MASPDASKASRQPRSGAWTRARRIVQACAILLFAAPLLVVGAGLFGMTSGAEEIDPTASSLPFFGSISSSSVGPVTIADPFAMLQVAAASKSFAVGWLVAALPVLVFYGLLSGRAFCGWTCPVNFLLEGVDWLRGKLGIRVTEHALPRHAKLWVALGVLAASAVSGLLVFEIFSPISAINKGILFGSVSGLLVLGAIVVAELFWARRVWCRALCPLGGFYEALGKVGVVRVSMDYESCTHCSACQKACLCDPEILDEVLQGDASLVKAGDCMVCGACVDACPTKALSLGISNPVSR